jgi:hypothetical protein
MDESYRRLLSAGPVKVQCFSNLTGMVLLSLKVVSLKIASSRHSDLRGPSPMGLAYDVRRDHGNKRAGDQTPGEY